MCDKTTWTDGSDLCAIFAVTRLARQVRRTRRQPRQSAYLCFPSTEGYATADIGSPHGGRAMDDGNGHPCSRVSGEP
jgi:hypothetical protein